MANKTINDLTGVTSAVADDVIPIWRKTNNDTRKIEKLDFIGATITGEGNIATGGYTLTVSGDATVAGTYEANADVTDAGNVGAAIHGTSAKTTPVDADTMPLIDSAASNVLKKVTWANVKATLKTYFDTLYGALATANTWALAQTFTSTITANSFLVVGGATKTIASGVITATSTYTYVDTQGGAGTDDLDTINGGVIGAIIILQCVSSARNVVIKNSTGNIKVPSDRTLNNANDLWIGMYNGVSWCELSFANNV